MAPKALGNLRLFTVEELSEILDIQQKTIRAMLKSGKLKGRKMGLRWHVTEDQLRDYFEAGQDE